MGIFSITDGLRNVVGAVGDVLGSPLKATVGGDPIGAAGDVLGAPFRLTAGTIQTGLGTATLPIRLPAQMIRGLYAGSSNAHAGAQSAYEMYLSRGYGAGYGSGCGSAGLYLPQGYPPYQIGGWR